MQFKFKEMLKVGISQQILTLPTPCLIPRTTMTSLSVPRIKGYMMHPLCVNPGVPF